MSDSEWQKMMAINVETSTLDEEAARQLLAKTENWYHSSYLWSIVNLAAYTSAKLTAKRSYHTLLFTSRGCSQSGAKASVTR